jgi:diguanylate cyclase (GGDEF)-like protein
VSLVLVDLDRFKGLNDTHGHPVGDRALVHLAQVLRRHAGPAATVARLGGDEFAVLLEEDGPSVTRRAEAICAAVRATPMSVREGSVGMTVSVGVATCSAGERTLDDLYDAADAALYAAKVAGRDQVASALRPS